MKKLFFPIFLSLASMSANSQADLEFKRYTTKQGLVYNDVLSICQDHLGFIWFGTKKGCSRFNGIDFKTYKYNKNKPGTIGEGWINDILCDNKNRLWFALAGTSSTLMRYDFDNECFIDVSSIIKEKINTDKKVLAFWSLFEDSEGLIWTNNSAGVVCYNPENENVLVFDSLSIDNIDIEKAEGFFEDEEKNIWMAFPYGVIIYNKKTNNLTRHKIQHEDLNRNVSEKCVFIHQDYNKNVWIGTHNGLISFSRQDMGTRSFKRYNLIPKNPNSLSSNIVYDILESDDYIYLATVNGLCLIEKNTDKIFQYYNDEYNTESINSNLIRTLFNDRQNNIWIGTNSGVARLQVKNFKSYSNSFYRSSISHNKVETMCQVSDSTIWIANPKGIDVFNLNNKKFHSLIDVSNSDNGLYAAPLVLLPDKDNRILIGTWNGGLSRYDFNRKKVENNIFDSIIHPYMNVFSAFVDHQNNHWIGIQHMGVFCYNPKTKLYKHFLHDDKNPNSLSSNMAYYIMQDSRNNILIGTDRGVNVLHPSSNDTITHFLEEREVNFIVETNDHNLWIATNMGLSQFNPLSQEFKHYDENNGLPGNEIQGIVEDHYHNLWITTNNGLVQLEFVNTTKTNISAYKSEEGINIGDFIERSCLKTKDGKILFGGTGGFCIFDPANIKRDSMPPIIIFTKLRVANENVRIGQVINDQIILRKSISVTKHLTFNHKNNAFSIQFTGLNYNLPQYNQYCYRLEGFDSSDSEWYFPPLGDREVEYMNLPPGDYILKIKAANSYRVWNNTEAQMKITVLPPWWKTNWFTALWICILIVFVFLFVKIRVYRLQKQKQKLEEIVSQRTLQLQEMNMKLEEGKEEIEQQAQRMSDMNKELILTNTNLEAKTIEVESIAKQLHEADQKQLRFFANISHEFRTPLTLIIGPVEKCLNLKKTADWNNVNITNYLQLIHRNSKRLLRLVNEIISFRKLVQGGKKINLSQNNICKFINEIVDAFSIHAKLKNIQLSIVNDEFRIKNVARTEELNIENAQSNIEISGASQLTTNNSPLITDFWFDPDIMEKILYNLISNAIKYTPEKGEVSVKYEVQSTKKEDDLIPHASYFILKVEDTGIGINPENSDKIFDRFYREDAEETSKHEGTGIGLAYTKELVELHHGIISVESEQKKGTTFTLQFPIERTGSKKEQDNLSPENKQELSLGYVHSMLQEEENDLSKVYDKSNSDSQAKENKRLNEIVQHHSSIGKSTILIVEDNEDLRIFIRSELESQYSIIEAKNGEQAMELVFAHDPNLIISDIMMPVMNGIEFCRKIKTDENTSHMPVILLTAKEGEENKLKGFETGADDYITKPFSMEILKLKIKNILATRQRLREKFGNSFVLPSEITTTTVDREFLENAIKIVEENIQNSDFSNETFIKLCNLSKPTVYKKIKNLTNQSLSEFIRSIRLKKSVNYLIVDGKNVKETAFLTGFKNSSVFTHYFSQMFKKTPTQYIRDHHS